MTSGLAYAYLNAACVTDPVLAQVSTARAWYFERGLPWGMVVPSGSAWPQGRRLLGQQLMAATPAHFSDALGARGPHLAAKRVAVTSKLVVATDNSAFGLTRVRRGTWLGPLCQLHGVRDGASVTSTAKP